MAHCDEMGATWPEQEAVFRWWNAHKRELIEAATAERLAVQRAKEKESAPSASTNIAHGGEDAQIAAAIETAADEIESLGGDEDMVVALRKWVQRLHHA